MNEEAIARFVRIVDRRIQVLKIGPVESLSELLERSEGQVEYPCSVVQLVMLLKIGARPRSINQKTEDGEYVHSVLYRDTLYTNTSVIPVPSLEKYNPNL